jgi:hypothetical protein
MRRYGEQKRTGTRNDDALAANIVTSLNQGLESTRSEYTRQCPAGERKKPLARPGGEDKPRVLEPFDSLRTFSPREQHASRGSIDDLAPGEMLGAGNPECIKSARLPRLGSAFSVGARFAPDLSTRVEVVVQNSHSTTCSRGCDCGG